MEDAICDLRFTCQIFIDHITNEPNSPPARVNQLFAAQWNLTGRFSRAPKGTAHGLLVIFARQTLKHQQRRKGLVIKWVVGDLHSAPPTTPTTARSFVFQRIGGVGA